MLRLCSKNIYLAALEKEHCRKLWEEYEYDFQSATEPLNIGHSNTKADSWFEEIQRDQGIKHIRLGVFLLMEPLLGMWHYRILTEKPLLFHRPRNSQDRVSEQGVWGRRR